MRARNCSRNWRKLGCMFLREDGNRSELRHSRHSVKVVLFCAKRSNRLISEEAIHMADDFRKLVLEMNTGIMARCLIGVNQNGENSVAQPKPEECMQFINRQLEGARYESLRLVYSEKIEDGNLLKYYILPNFVIWLIFTMPKWQ